MDICRRKIVKVSIMKETHFFLVRRFFSFLGSFSLRFQRFYSFTLCFRYNLERPSYFCLPPYFRPSPSTPSTPYLFQALPPSLGSSSESESLLLEEELSSPSPSPSRSSRMMALPSRPVTILWQLGMLLSPKSSFSTFSMEMLPSVRGMAMRLKTLSSTLPSPASARRPSSSNSSMIFSSSSSSRPRSMPRATMNWKRCQSEKTFTRRLLKKSLTLVMSRRRKSRACGWSCSTDCETSITHTLPSQKSMLYSLRSAWISLHSWYSTRMILTTYRQIYDHCSTLATSASFKRGAFFMSLPIKSITSTFDFTSSPTGLTITPSILFRFRISFSAHIVTILRGLLEQYPLRKRNSPSTYRSRSLKTRMEVLQILIAYYFLVVVLTAWQTLAYFPVERQPLISVTIQLLSNFSRILLVRQSRTCQTVALSALSLTRFSLVNSFCSHSPISLLILCRLIFVSSLVQVFSWQAFERPFGSCWSEGPSRLAEGAFFQKYYRSEEEDSLSEEALSAYGWEGRLQGLKSRESELISEVFCQC